MNIDNGTFRELEQGRSPKDREVQVKKGGLVTVQIDGEDFVFLVRDITKKDLILRLRVAETQALNPENGKVTAVVEAE